MPYPTTYHNITVHNGVNVAYAEAGSAYLPTILLLHGYPSSNRQYHNLIPLLASEYHVIAPSLPGFGLTTAPPSFEYTFDALAAVIAEFLTALNVHKYAVYMFDYGAPVALRLALQSPESIQAIISQNGNAYVEGLGRPFWDPIEALWKSNDSPAQREFVRENALSFEATKFQYVEGVPKVDLPLINPSSYTLDWLENVHGKANQERQLDLFYSYRTNVAQYPAFQQYFRDSQVPLLAIWGKNDPAFIPPGAEAFKKDLPKAEIYFVDAGHFALETKLVEISRRMLAFLRKIGY